MIGSGENEKPFVVIDESQIYIDMSYESVKHIVDYMRGYVIDFSHLSINTIMRLHRDSSVLGIEKLREHLDEYLPKAYNHEDIQEMVRLGSGVIDLCIEYLDGKEMYNKTLDLFMIPLRDLLKGDDICELITFWLSDKTRSYRDYINSRLILQCILEYTTRLLTRMLGMMDNDGIITKILEGINEIKTLSGVDVCSEDDEDSDPESKPLILTENFDHNSEQVIVPNIDSILNTITKSIKMISKGHEKLK